MATTTYLQLVLPVSEQDANKVATYNTEASDLDACIGGILTLGVAGASNVTLTRAQALNRLLKFTGVLTGNISVSLNPTLGCPRVFLVWNATTGAFTLTVKLTTGGSVGVDVTQGSKAELMHDGTNVEFAGAEV